MNQSELDSLIKNVEDLRKAVRRNDPLLRAVASSRVFSMLTLPFGIVLTGLFLTAHFLVRSRGSLADVGPSLKIALGLLLALFIVAGAIAKVLLIRKKASAVDSGAGFGTVLKAMYAGTFLHINLPALAAMSVATVFAIYTGHPWFVVPVTAIFAAFTSNGLGLLVGRPEYIVMGWYALVSGLVSLFLVEDAPWLWSGIIYGGMFVVFGAVGLLVSAREKKLK